MSLAPESANPTMPAPGSTIPMEGPVSLHADNIKVHEVPLVIATPETFEEAGYGKIESSFEDAVVDIVTWPKQGWRDVVPGTGNEGGITQGEFVFTWEGDMAVARNHAVDGHYVTGWFTDPMTASFDSENVDRSRIFVREANYHPDGSQIFCPKDGKPFVALLALPGDDVKPEDFVAFYCDGTFGIKIHPNIWHQPLFPIAERAVFEDKQGKVHACIAVDFVEEFSTYLNVPLPVEKPSEYDWLLSYIYSYRPEGRGKGGYWPSLTNRQRAPPPTPLLARSAGSLCVSK